MRKNLPIILLSALVVIGLLVGVGYYFQTYRHGKSPEEGLTVVTAESTTASNKRTLLAENKEGDFQLYAQGDKAVLVHQGKSKTFSGWSRYLTKERPKLYYTDLNGDKKKELVVRLVSGIDRSTGQELYTYDLFSFRLFQFLFCGKVSIRMCEFHLVYSLQADTFQYLLHRSCHTKPSLYIHILNRCGYDRFYHLV